LLDADGKKRESSCLPFVAQSQSRCVFRMFRPVVSFCNSAEQIVKPGPSSLNPPENGLTKIEQNSRGEKAQMLKFLRLKFCGGFLEACWKLPGLSHTV